MLPYFRLPPVHVGPLTIEPFGVLAAAGILFGSWVAARRAAQERLDPKPLNDFLVWGLLGGVLAGHLVHLFLYHPEELRDPLRIVRVWDGLSSFGGLLGGLIAAAWFFRRRNLSLLAYGDAFALGIAPGWAIARVGCFVIHDHPGSRTSFPLAIDFPPGAVDAVGGGRHDLGLYDALLLGALAVLLFVLGRLPQWKGRLLPILAIGYGIGRFFFDFLRATDVPYSDARYLGLTPAQYFSVLIVGWGAFQLARGRRQASSA